MFKKNFALFVLIICLAIFTSCSQSKKDTIVTTENTDEILSPNTDYNEYHTTSNTTETNNDTTSAEMAEIESDNQTSQTKSVIELPLLEKDLARAVPEFLTEEQQLLYRRARSIFPAFSGYPFQIDEYPTDGNANDYHTQLGDVIETDSTSGVRFYYAATGRYKLWDDFVSMGTSTFTDDYFAHLSELFLNIDGYTYIPDVAMGGRWGYLPELSPDTFNLISKSDFEIRFEVVGRYFDTCNVDTANPDTVRTESFPITMVMTNDGWRFSEFNSPS